MEGMGGVAFYSEGRDSRDGKGLGTSWGTLMLYPNFGHGQFIGLPFSHALMAHQNGQLLIGAEFESMASTDHVTSPCD